MSDIMSALSMLSCVTIGDFKNKFRQVDLELFSPLKPNDEYLKRLEDIVNRKNKRKKNHFLGPFEQALIVLKEVVPSIKTIVALFIYGIAEEMVYQMLKHTVYYEKESGSEEHIIGNNTIQTVLTIYKYNKKSPENWTQTNLPDNYEKCIEHLRCFVQLSYDQCQLLLRIFLEPVLKAMPVSNSCQQGTHPPESSLVIIRRANRFINSFMNIFRATLESIEDMNDHVSSGGSGRTGEQGLIGYCLELPAEDYLLRDFSTYAECITQRDFVRDVRALLDFGEVRRSLMTRGSQILQAFISKYSCVRGVSDWLHKGCLHCSVLDCSAGDSTASRSNEAFFEATSLLGDQSSSSVSTIESPIDHSARLCPARSQFECNYMVNCYNFLLPRLLYLPVFQFIYLQEIIAHFTNLSYDEDDRETLKDVTSEYRQESKSVKASLRNLDTAFFRQLYERTWLLHLKEYQPQLTAEFGFESHHMKLRDLDISWSGSSGGSGSGGGTANRNPELEQYLDSEFITKASLLQQNEKGKLMPRVVFLFHNVLLIYKEDSSWKAPLSHHHSSVAGASGAWVGVGGATVGGGSLRLKKIVSLDCIHVSDAGCMRSNSTSGGTGAGLESTLVDSSGSLVASGNDDNSYVSIDVSGRYFLFNIQFQELKKLTFVTEFFEIKSDWMACLLQIQTNKLFEKYIKELPRQEIPLRLPDPKKYRFAEPDSSENIRFEDTSEDAFVEINDEDDDNSEDLDLRENNYQYLKQMDSCGHPQIRYATLYKLIERLTYHQYHDLRALHMFLLAYRRFTTPGELLGLLIERFHVPPPDFTAEESRSEWENGQSPADQMLKRFKNSYQRRIQRRVIWVLLRWTQNPSFFRYDFADNGPLRQQLLEFVNSIKSKELLNACQVMRATCGCELRNGRSLVHEPDDFDRAAASRLEMDQQADWPVTIHSGISVAWTGISIFNVHPVEMARQITLYEWDLYHQIQYWEVEGKETSSRPKPNLARSKDFSNKLRAWFVQSVLAQEHPEDRAVAIMRVTDIMEICRQLNNFQGNQEARSALFSAAVFRLKKTFGYIFRRYRYYKNVLTILRKEGEGGKSKKIDVYTKKYEDNIRKVEYCNPPVPCVPFIALGTITTLIQAGIATQDTLISEQGQTLINFRKHVKLSQIIERYLSFQRLPYKFRRDDNIMRYLENLDHLGAANIKNEDEFEDRMFKLSETYETRDSDINSSFDNFPEKERYLSRLEQKLAESLNTSTQKDKLPKQFPIAAASSVASVMSSTTTLSSRCASSMSTSTLGSEPSTPTNMHMQQQHNTATNVEQPPRPPLATPPLPPRPHKMSSMSLTSSSPGLGGVHHFTFANSPDPAPPPPPQHPFHHHHSIHMPSEPPPVVALMSAPPVPPRSTRLHHPPPPLPARLARE